MIVTCERCTTQFQLDDSRVPEAGVRVRCSRCKHAFLVEPPAKNELDRIQRVARRALEESEEGPQITQDLPPQSVVEGGGDGADGPGAAPAASGAGTGRELADDDESDWTFNDGRSGAEGASGPEALSAARSAVDALLAGSPGGDASAGDLADSTDEADALDLELDARRPAAEADDDGLALDLGEAGEPGDLEEPAGFGDPSDLGDLGDLGGLGDLGDLAGAQEASGNAAPPELEVPPAPAEPPPPEPAPAAASAAPAPATAPDAADELGSPAEWDIFDEPAPPRAEPTARPAATPERRAERVEAPAPDRFDEPAEGGVWLPRIGAGLGWALTAGLCVFALAVGLAPRPPASAQAAAPAVAGLHLEEVGGRWLDNLRHGPLYVVSGWLRNRGEAPVPGARVALVLEDAAGRRLGEPVPLGPSVETRLLREARLPAIREAQSAAALPSVLAPRQGFPFEAVVGAVPPSARRFRFAESSPAPEPASAPAPRPVGETGETREMRP